ncbi:PDZ domain-containing protein [Phycisphaeraceae bacterium D3-23]
MPRFSALNRTFFNLSVAAGLSAVLLGAALPAVAQGRDRRGRTADRELQELMAPVIEDVRRSVVTIVGDDEVRALGTVVDERGYVLTKASEVAGSEVVVCRTDSELEFEARVVARDNVNDLMLLHIDGVELVPVTLVDEELAIGEWVIVAGPEEAPRQAGIVSTRPRAVAPNRLVLGVMLAPDGMGLVVTNLTEGYGAADAGVEVGDVITHLMGKKVIAIQQLVGVLQESAMGDSVTISLLRDGETMDLDIELRENEPDPRSRGERMNRMGGEVSDRNVGFERVIQHDAEIRPRDCGGPLVNLEGEVVGFNIARAGRIATYAIPASLVQEKIAELIAEDTEEAAVRPEG